MRTVETYRVLELLDPDKNTTDVPGAITMYTDVDDDDLVINYYFGPSGKTVSIIVSDEVMDEISVKNNMELLGLPELIPILFPADPSPLSDESSEKVM